MPKASSPSFIRTVIPVRIPLIGVLDQAGAVSFLVSFVPGFELFYEKARFVPDVAGAGGGATQGLRVRKGNASGTIIDTLTVTLANHVMGAASVSSTGAAASADVRFGDTDAFSITKDAGTVFSGGGGTLELIFRQRPQARA